MIVGAVTNTAIMVFRPIVINHVLAIKMKHVEAIYPIVFMNSIQVDSLYNIQLKLN